MTAAAAPPLNLHALVPASRANGPGLRAVVWLQGCSRGCPGCANPGTHDPAPRWLVAPGELADRLAASPGAEGVTLTGGEPLEQAEGVLELLERLRSSTSLSVVLFTGCDPDEVRALPHGPGILARVDVLVAGPYRHDLRAPGCLGGSSNQVALCLTDRYRPEDLEPTVAAEVLVAPDGRVTVTGPDPPRLPTPHDGRGGPLVHPLEGGAHPCPLESAVAPCSSLSPSQSPPRPPRRTPT